MTTHMPETVLEAWGKPAVRDFTAWLEGVMAERSVGRDEFGQLGTRLTGVEDRLTGVETRLTVVEHDVAGGARATEAVTPSVQGTEPVDDAFEHSVARFMAGFRSPPSASRLRHAGRWINRTDNC